MSVRFYNDVVPFAVMVGLECSLVGTKIVYKAADTRGMSSYAYLVYSYALAALILLPACLFFLRSPGGTKLPSSKFSLVWRICLAVLIGALLHICGNKGIELSSPTLASAINSLMPAFTFIAALILRMEKLNLRSSSSLYKLAGTIISISGALVVLLYEGPAILSPKQNNSQLSPLHSSLQSNWIIGGLILTGGALLYTLWLILMTEIMVIYPAKVVVSFFYCLGTAITSGTIYFIADHNVNNWRLGPSIGLALVAILCNVFFMAIGSNVVQSWGLHLKGPLYVAMFSPLSIAIAAVMSSFFLAETLYLGCVVGAIIITVGFYAVIWGKAEEEEKCDNISSREDSSSEKMPLLRSHEDNIVEKHVSINISTNL